MRCVLSVMGIAVAVWAGWEASGATAKGDPQPPRTTISSATVVHRTARFQLRSSAADPKFRCKLDHRGFHLCSSPKIYRHLASGLHTFKVEAIDTSGPRDRTPATKQFRIRKPPGTAMTGTFPGSITSDGEPFFSEELISPVLNYWGAGSHRRLTAVEAGKDPNHKGRGAFGILRQNFVWESQTEDLVSVPGSGAVKITKAPLGKRAEGRAQRKGRLRFVGRRGVTGTLHLSDDTVTLQQTPSR
jgi:hypothetical protein